MPRKPNRAVRSVAALALACALGWGSPDRVRGDERDAIPDPVRLAALRGAAARAHTLRVSGTFGEREFQHVVIDSSGVRSTDWERGARTRPALFTATAAPPPAVPEPIAWSRISTIEVLHPFTLKGAVTGAVLGTALGLVFADMSVGGASGGWTSWRTVGIFGGTLTAFTVGGAVIGSMTGSRTIYAAIPLEND